MAEFADRMKSFTDHLRNSIQMRNEALAQVHSSTEDLRNRAREFMDQTADEHRNRAEELHATLTAHREECRERAAELRENHQESLRKTRTDLQRMLSESRKTRQDTVNQLCHTFEHARNELALDLREASFAWRAFAARQDEPVTAASSAPAPPKKSEPKPAKGAKRQAKVHHR
jgi:sulfite reductase alpha subunit-like flavoprotein